MNPTIFAIVAGLMCAAMFLQSLLLDALRRRVAKLEAVNPERQSSGPSA